MLATHFSHPRTWAVAAGLALVVLVGCSSGNSDGSSSEDALNFADRTMWSVRGGQEFDLQNKTLASKEEACSDWQADPEGTLDELNQSLLNRWSNDVLNDQQRAEIKSMLSETLQARCKGYIR